MHCRCVFGLAIAADTPSAPFAPTNAAFLRLSGDPRRADTPSNTPKFRRALPPLALATQLRAYLRPPARAPGAAKVAAGNLDPARPALPREDPVHPARIEDRLVAAVAAQLEPDIVPDEVVDRSESLAPHPPRMERRGNAGQSSAMSPSAAIAAARATS